VFCLSACLPGCSVRPEVEKAGLLSSKESCWSYYVQKCRNNLHVVLAMSPVGETLRTRCRNFPGMVNNTVRAPVCARTEEGVLEK
jgi:hypothetical protein